MHFLSLPMFSPLSRPAQASAFALLLLAASAIAQTPAPEFSPQPPVPALSPAETLKTFKVPDGYRLEAVLTEPEIKEPVVAAFDGNGRMFVAEMRTYMQDIDGTNEHAPVSRISLHWSSKGDGRFDKHTVFIDKLLLPRMILPLGPGELLVNETDTQDIYLYRDTNNDGVSDEKKLWLAGGPRGGNLEHQQSGLIWGIDNWLYMTYNSWRIRWTPNGEVLKEPTAGNGGQWGLTQDDHGKPWYVNAGGERGPLNFQTHILYGAFNLKDQFAPGYVEVWPLVGIPDVQGGEGRFRPVEKTLNHFTATCGAEVFRGDRLPADIRGDLLFSEPVGRLIRRTKAEVKDGLTYLKNAYDKSEFILSTDPNFRVVNMNTAPDGTLYLVDMYRGIIQEGNWTREGSYLRKAIQQYGLEKNVARGRIWRLVHKDFAPGPQPKMNDEKAAQLVAHLTHPNGWWRDTAQKLLVLRQDKSVVPALAKLAREHANYLTRLHALWTLEGLQSADPALIREKMADTHPQLRAAAIRVSETLYKAGDKSFEKDISKLAKDKDGIVSIQAMLTAMLLKFPDANDLVQAGAVRPESTPGMKEIAMQLLAPPRSWGNEYSGAEKNLMKKGDGIFRELCFACHNPDGRGTPVEGRPGVTMAPPFAGSRTVNGSKEGMIAVLLKGLTGPINGRTYDAQMLAMESNNDEWIASVVSFVRNSFGNKASTVSPGEVAALRATLKDRTTPFTIQELAGFEPPTLNNRSAWKLSASHNAGSLAKAADGNPETRYDTDVKQESGMWFQIELPAPAIISGVRLDTSASANDYPRGYNVELSSDGVQWGKPVATGKGKSAITEMVFAPTATRFIRVTQTGESGGYWSIHECDLLLPTPR